MPGSTGPVGCAPRKRAHPVYILLTLAVTLFVPHAVPAAEQYDVLGAMGQCDWDSDRNGIADGWWFEAPTGVAWDARLASPGIPRDGWAQMLSVQAATGHIGRARLVVSLNVGSNCVVDEGDRLTVSAYMKTALFPGSFVAAHAFCWGPSSLLLDRPLADLTSSDLRWHQYQTTVTVPAGTVRFEVEFKVGANAGQTFVKTYLDDVQITKEVSQIPLPKPGAVRAVLFDNAGSDVVYAARRYDVYIGHETQSTNIHTFRLYHPDALVLLYEMSCVTCNLGWTNDPIGINWIRSHYPNWFLLGANGQQVCINSEPWFLALDIGNPDFQRIWAANAIAHARTLGVDGIMIDSVASANYLGFNTFPAKYPDDQSYMRALDSFVRHVVPQIKRAGLKVIGNGGGVPWNSPPWSDWMLLFDGRVYEPPCNATRCYYESESTWQNLMESHREFPDKIYVHFLPYYPDQDQQLFEFSFASFLLWKGPSSYAGCHDIEGPVVLYHPLLDVPIGEPLGEARQVGLSTYQRSFERGEVFVNADPINTETVQIPLGLVDVSGNPAPSGPRQLGPREALILLTP